MYHIVGFVDTEEVEVVPAIWVKSDNYSEACQKLPLAEQQTKLQSYSLMPPKCKIKRDMCPLDDYDRDEEATTPLKNNFPQAPQIYLLSKRICSASNELQPSAVGQSQSQSPGVTQIVETSRPSLLEISPGSEWHENTLLPRQISQQPRRTSSSDRASQDTTEHKSEVTWPQDTSVQSPEQPAQSPRHHETPRPQRKSLSSYDPFLTSLLHDILTKQEILMEQQKKIMRMVQDLKANNVSEITETNLLSPEQCPVEDLRSLTSPESDLQSCPETRIKVETYSGSGEDEMTYKDEESCPIQIEKQQAPKMGKPCGPTCGKKCTQKIPHVRRKEIFNAYKDMSHSDKWTFVFHSVTQSLKTRFTTGGPSRRNKTFQYHLNNSLGQPQEVCKTFYLTTLGYHPKNDRVIVSVTGNKSGAVPPPDRRGRHPPPNKIDLTPIHQHIQSFNPTISDCKCEHAESRRYLPSNVTIMMMYKDFKGKSSTVCSYETYRKAIKDMNIGFRKLSEEECKKCLEGDTRIKTEHL
ncbi:hypothetical protein cypCar_00020568 [Cyprinus carpio]|uniref:Uncharacterized protein LOC109088899 isoform X1 n=4 Tax=Cyprinus carpio TaxID=7962 RepID=A0A9R0ANB3_CYPCA|nr:uncharacterized protein LOC109088899 isoform X1 [Cyprinus carpio]KTF84572.1 hypothetical protein cypCar_00020568 [Cyprinus carpio]